MGGKREFTLSSVVARPQAPLTFSPDGHQFHPFAGYVIQSLVDVRNLVEPHFAPVRFGQPFPCRTKWAQWGQSYP